MQKLTNGGFPLHKKYGFNPTSSKDIQQKYQTLSKVILTDWVFKIIFGNILKRHWKLQ